jgi:hypothetical protein
VSHTALPVQIPIDSTGTTTDWAASRLLKDIDVPSLLKGLDPKAGDKLRRVLIRDLIDFLILHKEERPKALRLLGKIKAAERR